MEVFKTGIKKMRLQVTDFINIVSEIQNIKYRHCTLATALCK